MAQKRSQGQTGPKTVRGKNRSRWNALKHGRTAKSAVLPFESETLYREHCREVERSLVLGDRERADEQRAQSTWSSLGALTLTFANMRAGRSSVLLVSEHAEAATRRRGLDGLPTSTSVTRAANRGNVALYVLDPAETPQADLLTTQETV